MDGTVAEAGDVVAVMAPDAGVMMDPAGGMASSNKADTGISEMQNRQGSDPCRFILCGLSYSVPVPHGP